MTVGPRRPRIRRLAGALAPDDRRPALGAGGRVRPRPRPDLHEPVAPGGLPGRRRRDGRPVVRLRPRPRRARRAPRLGRPGPPAAVDRAPRACDSSASSAGRGSSPRGSSAGRATPTSRRSSCGSTAGSGSRSCPPSSGRSGTGSTRSRRCTTSAPRSCAGSASKAGSWPPTRNASVDGRPSSASSSSSGSSSSSRPARRSLFIVLVGYTALSLAMMAQFGRDAWRANAEVFTVWFRLLGRLAPYALVDETRHVRRRSFASGLLETGWTAADVVIVALGVGVDPVRRAVTDDSSGSTSSALAAPSEDGPAARIPGHRRRRGPGRHPIGRARRDGRRPAADRRRLPDRPLPDVPAHRRPAHRRRHLRPVPARLGPVRHGVLRARRRLAAAGSRLDDPAGRRRRRAHARGVGRACRGRARRAARAVGVRPCGDARSRSRS